jgi:hypothetical protein
MSTEDKIEKNIGSYNTRIEKTSTEIDFDNTLIEKDGKPLESYSLTGVLDDISESLDSPRLSISNFGFFNWKRFEEKMNSLWDKVNYYPPISATEMLSEYADLGTNINEVDLLGTASSIINIASFEIGARRRKINKGRYDLRPKSEFSNFSKEKIQESIEDDYLDDAYESPKDIDPDAPDAPKVKFDYEDLVYAKDSIEYTNLKEQSEIIPSEEIEEKFSGEQDERSVSSEQIKGFEEEQDERSVSSDQLDNFNKEQDERSVSSEQLEGFNREQEERSISSDQLDNFNKEQDERSISSDQVDGFEEEKEEISADIVYDFKKFDTEKNDIVIYKDINKNFDVRRITEEINSIGYIYVSPVNDDAIASSKFIRIPLQNNLVNNGETLKAEYNTIDFLGRVGSVKQYVRTSNQTYSLETHYHVDSENESGYTMQDLQKIEMIYKSLLFPKEKQVDDKTYSFYTRPPIINIEIGNLSTNKNPTLFSDNLNIVNKKNNNKDVINNFFTRIKYSDENNFTVEFKDFIVTDINIEKDYEKTPFFLEKASNEINGEVKDVYLPRDLMGFKVSIEITEIDPNYFGILPSFDDYASFAIRG